MFVLGIDPGLSRCGYAVVEPGPRGRGRAVAMGVIRTSPQDEIPIRLAELHGELNALLDEFSPAVVSVERIFFQNNVRTAVGVAQASGLALALASLRGITVAQYSPNAVKSVVAGDGKAEKVQVQEMVQFLLGLKTPPKPADAADAAALALCHLAHDPQLRSTSGSGASAVTGGAGAGDRRDELRVAGGAGLRPTDRKAEVETEVIGR